jgi:hypothetical protein
VVQDPRLTSCKTLREGCNHRRGHREQAQPKDVADAVRHQQQDVGRMNEIVWIECGHDDFPRPHSDATGVRDGTRLNRIWQRPSDRSRFKVGRVAGGVPSARLSRLCHGLLYPAASLRDLGGAPSDRICGASPEPSRRKTSMILAISSGTRRAFGGDTILALL